MKKIRIRDLHWSRLKKKADRRPLVRDTLTTTFWMVIGKSIGFLIPLFIAAWFGVDRGTDSFFFVYGLVFFLSSTAAVTVENIIVPFLAEKRARGEDVGAFVGNLMGAGGAALAVLTAVLVVFADPLFTLLTRFDPATRRLSVKLFIEIAPLITLMFWSSLMAGAMNTFKRFALPAFSPAIRAVVILAWIFFLKAGCGVHAVALGYIIGEFCRCLLYVFAIRKWRLFKLKISLRMDARLKDFVRTAIFQVIAITIGSLNPFIDKIMASWIAEGSVSVLHYADRLYKIPTTIFTSGLLVTLLSHWSHKYYRSGPKQLRGDVRKALGVVAIWTVPLCAGLILFHRPIVRLLFGWGRFDASLHARLGWTWVGYLAGLLPFTLSQVFISAHITMKSTRILMHLSLVIVALNIALNLILMPRFQVVGLALATSGVSIVSTALFSLTFYPRLRKAESAHQE